MAEGRVVKQPEPQVLPRDSGRGQNSQAARATGTARRYVVAEGRVVKQPDPLVLPEDSGRGQSSQAAGAKGTVRRL